VGVVPRALLWRVALGRLHHQQHSDLRRDDKVKVPKTKRIFKCHTCEAVLKTVYERTLRPNPYIEEIHSRIEKGRWCKSCEHEMLMDI
jgi:hypothetical protein